MMVGYAFHVRLLHSLLFAGFHRRFHNVPQARPSTCAAIGFSLDLKIPYHSICGNRSTSRSVARFSTKLYEEPAEESRKVTAEYEELCKELEALYLCWEEEAE